MIGGVGLVLGGALLVGPGAPVLVETLLDGRSLGQVGTLQISGVSGAHLGALRARTLAVHDKAGVWIELADVDLRWRPWALLAGRVRVDQVSVAAGRLHKRPELLPPSGRRALAINLRIDALRLDQLSIDPAVGGPAASLGVTGQLELRDGALVAARLEALRLDAPTDQLALVATTTTGLQVDATVTSQPGGLLAGLLDLDSPLTGAARISGTQDAGGGPVQVRVGDDAALVADLAWTKANWSLTADLTPRTIPALAPLTARLGPDIDLAVSGTRTAGWSGPARLSARAAAGQFDAEGTLDGTLRPEGRWQLTARGVDVARLWPGQAGQLNATGWAERTEAGLRFSGQANAQQLTRFGARASLAGPIAMTADQSHIDVRADLRGAGLSPPVREASLRFTARIDRSDWRVVDLRADAEGPLGALQVQGPDLSSLGGTWRVANLSALIPTVRGSASGQFTWDGAGLMLRGTAAALAGLPEEAGRLLGTQPSLTVSAEPRGRGLYVRAATLSGPRLRLGARGLVTSDQTDLTIEGSARGPFSVAANPVLGVIDATGSVRGPRGQEVLELRATGTDVQLNGRPITPANGTLRYALGGRDGRFSATGQMDGLPVAVAGQLAQGPAGIGVEGLEGRLAGLQATGRIGADRVELTLAGRLEGLADLRGQVNGQFSLASGPTGQRITAALRLDQGEVSGVAISAASLTIDGPALAAPLRYQLRGRALSAPVDLAGTGTLTLAPGGWRASLNGEGTLAGTVVATEGPASLSSRVGQFSASAPLRVGAGSLDLRFARSGTNPEIDLIARSVPVAPLGALFGERASGDISGQLRLTGAGAQLVGNVDLAADQVRWARRITEPVTAKLALGLAEERLSGQVRVTTTSGFVGEARGAIAVRTDAGRWRIAPQPAQTGELAWDIAGPAEALWGLVGSLDQSVTGAVSGSGQLRFSADQISGQGQLKLDGGQIEDRQSGLILTDVAGEVVVGPAGPELISLTARDRSGGRLQAQGDGPGRIALQLDRLTLINRREVRAQADGALSVSFSEGAPLISGSLTLREALANNVLDPAPSVPQIDIVEVNRPDLLAPPEPARPRTGLVPRLDVTIRAPRRLLTRSRGAEAEWSLDAKVTGTLAAPLIRGEARLLRGDFQIAGRPFDVDRGIVRFVGPPEEAQIDITGQRVDPELTVRVQIGGTIATPELSLSSDPALPEDEILPQLLFGRSVQDLSAVQAAQLAASVGVLAGAGAFDVAEIARRAVGLDRLDVREDGSGFLVAGGRYLTRTVYLEVARSSVGDASTRIEWRLRPQLTIVTSFLASGDQRASLRWRRESN